LAATRANPKIDAVLILESFARGEQIARGSEQTKQGVAGTSAKELAPASDHFGQNAHAKIRTGPQQSCSTN